MTIPEMQTVGLWGVLLIMVFEKAIIPLANKVIPQKVKASIDYDMRVVAALEASNKNSAAIIEILRQYGSDHATIITALNTQSSSLAVLVDREKRKKQ